MTDHSKLTPEQYQYLLYAVAGDRVKGRTSGGKTLSYLEQHDVRRTLIRVFGFGGYSAEVLEQQLMFERERPKSNGQGNNFYVGYLVRLRLHIPQLDATYTESAVGSSTHPELGDAHDFAVKAAASDALKRAAMNLGTQFGLSLYFGTRKDMVNKTLIEPEGYEPPEGQVVDKGQEVNERTAVVPSADDMAIEETGPRETAITADDEDAGHIVRDLANAKSVQEVMQIKANITKAGMSGLMWEGMTLAKHCDAAVVEKGRTKLGQSKGK